MSSPATVSHTEFVDLAAAVQGSTASGERPRNATKVPGIPGPDPTEQSSPHAPRVEVRRSADGAETLEFICSCGERLSVRVEYDGD